MGKKMVLSSLALWLTLALISLPVKAQDVVTSFEFNDTDGSFTLGTPPKTVTFTGGLAQTVGILSLYHTGTHSWMIPAGGTGTITFETPASEVKLYLRDQTSAVASVLTLRDTSNNVIQVFNGNTANWTEVQVNSVQVKTITLKNNASGGGSPWAVIDDFSVEAAEEPPPPPIPPTLVFTQFVNGQAGGFNNASRVILRNNHALETVAGQIRFKDVKDSSGQPVTLDPIQYCLPPFNSTEITTSGTGELVTGVVEVAVESGDASELEGTLIFQLLGSFVSIDATPIRSKHQVYVSFDSQENTGVAGYNPDDDTSSTIEMILLDQEGVQVTAPVQQTIDPMKQLIGFVNQPGFFPGYFATHPNFKGTLNIRVISGEDVAFVGLIQELSNGALLAVATSSEPFIP